MTSPKDRVLLIGSGGIGTIAALNLEIGGLAEVTSVLRSNFQVVRSKGFTIRSCQHGDIHSWRPTESLDAIPSRYAGQGRPFDFIVCCTKNIPDIIPTLYSIVAPAVTPGHTAIVLIQNGINIERPFIHRFPKNVIVSGISKIDAHEVAPGVIEQKQNDLLYIGAFNNPYLDSNAQEAAAKRFVQIYSMGGKTTCLYKPDVDVDRWSKLVYNVSFNPVCALTRLNTGELQRTGRVMDTLVVPAMKEVLAVAKKAGHSLPESIISDTIQTNPINESITPSMQIDLEKELLCDISGNIHNDPQMSLAAANRTACCLHPEPQSIEVPRRNEGTENRGKGVKHALSIAAPSIDAYNNTNAQELFAFSILTIYYSFAQTPEQKDGPYPPWVVLISGCTSFLALSNSTLSLGPFSALLSKARRRMKCRQQVFKTDYMQQLRVFVDESVTDPARRSIYQEALVALNQTYGVFYEVDGDKDLVDIFSGSC
ncbi:hypothetical protein HG530_001449 [Fusarium avenaceum]|nr:hypothetical protein HG530_001449 [Fusarium avenaceum]